MGLRPKGVRVPSAALFCILVASAASSPALAQDVRLTGLAGQAVSLSPSDISGMPHVSLSVKTEGQTHSYQGVRLSALLQRVGAPQGALLRGKDMRDIVIVSGRDGYAAAFALAETDPGFRDDQIILADRVDGSPLADIAGPYRLIVEGDLRAARSVRMVASIEVRQLNSVNEH